jgi:hypothetical protein
MSYSFNVEVKDGKAAVAGDLTHVPEGTFAIGGHEDADWLSVSITRKDPAGKQIAQASGYGVRH